VKRLFDGEADELALRCVLSRFDEHLYPLRVLARKVQEQLACHPLTYMRCICIAYIYTFRSSVVFQTLNRPFTTSKSLSVDHMPSWPGIVRARANSGTSDLSRLPISSSASSSLVLMRSLEATTTGIDLTILRASRRPNPLLVTMILWISEITRSVVTKM